MDTVYTTTLTDEAKRRGIAVEILDPTLPIFTLSLKGKSVRCFNGLTDLAGAATFHLANDKGAANRFLRERGFPVPKQARCCTYHEALSFLRENGSIVVKPSSQWGGRGVSTHITTEHELRAAIIFARKFSEEVILEECISGADWRLIYVDFRFVAAIRRNPATVSGNSADTIRALIKKKNRAAPDPSNRIPLDRETERCIESLRLTYETIPAAGVPVQVRRTTNYHTGGSVDIITDLVNDDLRKLGERVARAFALPFLGVDFLVDWESRRATIIEVSPDCAISPPEGETVAGAFLDMLFPGSGT
jgi:D-alanine-D-alanine ligase-like ATP-grasp enzyme